MGKSKKQTIGYRYYMTLHMGLCRGPINKLKQINVGDVEAWPVPANQGGGSGSGYPTVDKITGLFGLIGVVIGQKAQVSNPDDPSEDGLYQLAADGRWVALGDGSDAAITESGMIRINAGQIFGGDKKEGGIEGDLAVLMGEPTQVAPSLLTSIFGELPGFRRMVTLGFSGLICSMNPYPKTWSFRCARWDMGWQNDAPWYPAKARILMADGEIDAMNAAHIIYEALTNGEWGRGLDPVMLDENSFILAANTLCAELFGLCLFWYRQEDVDKFIQTIIDHIGAALYTDRTTGLITLRLVRNDYDLDDVPLFTPETGLLDLEDDDSGISSIATNEVIVSYKDVMNRGKKAEARVQNLAGFQASGEIVSKTVEYPAAPTYELAARLGQRDLLTDSAAIKRFKVKLDRRGWRIAPGSVFRISAPSRGIEHMVLRAGPIDDGKIDEGSITITAAQDIFGMPETSFVSAPPGPGDGGYTPPDQSLVGATARELFEVSYRDRKLDGDDTPTDEAIIGGVAAQPSGAMLSVDLWTKPSGGSQHEAEAASWAPHGRLAATINAYDETITLVERSSFAGAFSGSVLIAGSGGHEICNITSFDAAGGVIGVDRGCADTVPRAHSANTHVYICDGFIASDPTAYADGETVAGRFLSVASSGSMDYEAAPQETVTVVSRADRPYPPADVQINSAAALYAGTWVDEADDLVLTWVHRDRLTQVDQLVGHGEAGVGPEAGTTYNVRIYQPGSLTPIRTATAISGTSYTYSAANWVSDGSYEEIRIELESERDSLASWQKYSITVFRNPAIVLDESGRALLDETGAPLLDES